MRYPPAPAARKKPAQSPLERIDHAISQCRTSAFDRALGELWVSGEKFGNWQHRVLGLLMSMSNDDATHQFAWVHALLNGPRPPRPTPQENFLGLAYKRKAWGLVEILANAGFTADPSDVLPVLLEMPDTDPHKQVRLLQALLVAPNAPRPQDHRHLVEQVITKNAFHLLPALHAAGFSIEPSPDYERKVAAALGRGVWSYPELIMPKLMESGGARDALCSAMSVSLLESVDRGAPGFLRIDHIRQFCTLHIPKRISLRSKIHDAIHQFGSRAKEDITPTDDTTQSLMALSDACLVDIGKIERGNTHNPNILSLIAPVFAQREFDDLANHTPTTQIQRSPTRRI